MGVMNVLYILHRKMRANHAVTPRSISRQEIKISVCLIKHCPMKTCESGDIAYTFLTSALEGDEWSALRASPGLTPEEEL
jgi:hypothetical protein